MTTPKPTVSPHVNIDLSLLIFYQPPIEKLTNHLLAWPAMYAQLLAKKQVQEQQKQSNNETKDGDDGITLTEEDIENLIEQGFSEETIESVSKAVNEQLSKNANDDAKQDDNADNNLPKGDDANQTHSKIKPITKKMSPNDFAHTSSPNQSKVHKLAQNPSHPATTDTPFLFDEWFIGCDCRVWAVSKFTCGGDWCDVNCDADRPDQRHCFGDY